MTSRLQEPTDRSGSHKLSHLRLSSFVVCLWSQGILMSPLTFSLYSLFSVSTTIIAITSVVASIISMLIIGGIAACCYRCLCSGRSDSRPIRDRPSRDPTVVVNNIQAGPKSERPPPVRPPPVRPPPVRPLPRLRPMPSFWHPPRPQPEPLCSSLRWKAW